MNSLTMLPVFLVLLFLCSCAERIGDAQEQVDTAIDSTEVFVRDGLRVSLSDGQLQIEDAFAQESFSIGTAPYKRIVLSSTTQLRYFQALGQVDRVLGCPWLDFVLDDEIIDLRKSGALMDITQGAGLDLEKVVSLAPDLMLYDPRAMEFVPRLRDLGVMCIPFYEYREQDALRRADWLQLTGMLSDESSQANELRQEIKRAYEAVKVAPRDEAPIVLIGSYYQGTWSAAGGGSLVAAMLRDAGAQYALRDHAAAAVDLDLEQLTLLLAEVDYLGIIQQGDMSRLAWSQLDPRFELSQLDEKKLFYCNTSAADYFGKGVLEPEIMLQDLVNILTDADEDGTYFHLAE